MTEAEWLACTNPQPMLEFLRRKASDRKVRLFAVACCRRVWSSLEHDEFRDAVRKAELFADDLADRAEMLHAHEKACAIFGKLHGKDNGAGAALTASGLPSPPKSFPQRIADALDDPWWEDEFDKGDPLAPARHGSRHGETRGTGCGGSTGPELRPRCPRHDRRTPGADRPRPLPLRKPVPSATGVRRLADRRGEVPRRWHLYGARVRPHASPGRRPRSVGLHERRPDRALPVE